MPDLKYCSLDIFKSPDKLRAATDGDIAWCAIEFEKREQKVNKADLFPAPMELEEKLLKISSRLTQLFAERQAATSPQKKERLSSEQHKTAESLVAMRKKIRPDYPILVELDRVRDQRELVGATMFAAWEALDKSYLIPSALRPSDSLEKLKQDIVKEETNNKAKVLKVEVRRDNLLKIIRLSGGGLISGEI